MRNYDTFEEIEELLSGINDVLKLVSNNEVQLPSALEQSFKEFKTLCKEILRDREKSEYFQLVSPFDVVRGSSSQGRAITTNPEHLIAVKESIRKANGVKVAGFLTQCPKSNNKEIVNMNHRDAATEQLIEEGSLPEDYRYPAIVIPSDIAPSVKLAIEESQGILNSGLPKSLANTNDVQKDMTNFVNNYNVDLDDKKKYDSLVKYFDAKYSHVSKRTIKSNLTRVKNKKANFNGHVLCDTPKGFIGRFTKTHNIKPPTKKSKFHNIHVKNQQFKNCSIEFISTKGSVLDQRVWRDIKFKDENPAKPICHLFACQDNKGDPQTTIKSRETYFKHLYRIWRILDRLDADLVVISPQIESSFTAKIADIETVIAKKEIPKLKSSWTIITKQELIAFYNSKDFDSTRPYKTEWVSRPDNKSKKLKLVV